MRVRVVTSLREFDALAPVWHRVLREGGQTSPFVSHDWFACCWRSAGPDCRREAWVFEEAGTPVAALPLLHWRARARRLPVRALSVMTSPDTPFVDLPVARASEDVLPALFAALRKRRDWDIFSLAKLPVDSTVAKSLNRTVPDDFRWRVAAATESPFVDITGDWKAFLQTKSQRFRKTCRNTENRIRKAGGVRVEEHREVSPDGPLFTEVLDVASQSWKGPRALAMSTMPGMLRFFSELTRRASANGWLRLWLLRLDGKPVATEYQIVADGAVHALRADFDGSIADLSPGAYLNQHIIRTLFERGTAVRYEMGPGLNEYKTRWATGVHKTQTVEVYAPTPYGRFLYGVETRLVPLVRDWRAALKASA